MKKLLLLLAVAFAATTFTSCNKDTKDDTIAGTEWEAKAGDVTRVLRFVDNETCTLTSGRQGIYGDNLEKYLYEPYVGADGLSLYTKCGQGFVTTSYLAKRIDGSTLTLSPVVGSKISSDCITFKKR